tara:strand:+ start:205 stop:378 length:174 start_codon:yes stop_codon:yes gene_type:complete
VISYLNEYFEYLSDLRESGRMNMNGAPAMLRSVFGLNKKDAYEVFFKWTEWLENGSK